MNTHLGNLTQSIDFLVRELVADRAQARHRECNTAARLDRLAAFIGPLGTNTTCLSRHTVSLQIELGHFAGDVARGLGHISPVVDILETRQAARGTGDTPQDSEEGSTIMCLPLMRMCCRVAVHGRAQGTKLE
ncbi:hypothetical protein NDU88_010439 [Pleurodeles waltl]|uniref:Uncharacterized protein n=1 Tax=Pleurodeles waltl TaxID=8319 RepID=A0AAV7RY93_PLEWA|nr:hypothetical protein NDU88_010439 [Pleurodeles waltl]